MNPKVYEFESRICEAEKKAAPTLSFPWISGRNSAGEG